MTVSPAQSNFYAEWRQEYFPRQLLREADAPFPESLLQNIWFHQRLLRDQLRTLDGKTIRILHPGFWNHSAGPDFRHAVLQIENQPPVSGDIEIDLRSSGWRAHGHDQNADFSNVILHVIWEADAPAKISAPTLALENFLDAPIAELNLWLGGESARNWPENILGKCCAPLRDLSAEKLKELLRQAALVRLQRKAGELQARARRKGWEQALWEGMFRALGYKQNVWPMQRLAELILSSEPGMGPEKKNAPRSALEWQSRLLGLSGLLPTQPDEVKDNKFLRSIWDIWWRERDKYNDLILPKSIWRFHGMRPANHPQRRIALAAHWLADKLFFQKLEAWFLEKHGGASEDALLKLLQINNDAFWAWQWTFRSARLRRAQPLIGIARMSDLAINVILPWFWVRAVSGKNEGLRERAEKIYFAWPTAEDNAVLRLARNRLLGGAPAKFFNTAALQQGLLQIVRDFCEHSNAICADCRFPELVRSWKNTS
ncbi:MAG: DUF2851 family protein [Verrucomicrobiota bacterium]